MEKLPKKQGGNGKKPQRATEEGSLCQDRHAIYLVCTEQTKKAKLQKYSTDRQHDKSIDGL